MKPEEKIVDKVLAAVLRVGRPGRVLLGSNGVIDFLSEKSKETGPGALSSGWKKLKQWSWLRRIVLWLNSYPNRVLRLLLVSVVAFMMLVVTIWFGVFFISDVILHETEFEINEMGTINPKKALDSEYAFFLFNTSEVWANPGIQVNKRDRIKISISGGFHSSVEHAMDAAKGNYRPKYPWVSPDTLGLKNAREPDWALKYCLSRGPTSPDRCFRKTDYYDFGTVLYTIQEESSNIKDHPLLVDVADIRAWHPQIGFHRVHRSGYLYFAINDLVFDGDEKDNQIDEYYDTLLSKINHNRDSINTERLSAPRKPEKEYEIELSKLDEEQALAESEKQSVKNDRFFLYKDNLGQLLVAVEIQRHNASPWRLPERLLRRFENNNRWFEDALGQLRARSTFWQSVLSCRVIRDAAKALAAFFFFLLFGFFNLMVFFIWTILVCIGICLICLLLRTLRNWIRPLFYSR